MTMTEKNLNRLTLFEALEIINENPEKAMGENGPFKFHPNSPLHKLFKCAYLKEYKFKFPSGKVPYRPSEEPEGMTDLDLLSCIIRGRLEYFYTDNIKQVVREKIFIDLLEKVHRGEAEVLVAVKDQRLQDMFPNLTYETLAKYGYLPPKTEIEQTNESDRSFRTDTVENEISKKGNAKRKN